MSVIWFAVSLYLVFCVVAVFEAEVEPLPGSTPFDVCVAALLFGLAQPIRSVLRRVRALI